MESIDTELAARIRNDIFHGAYAEGERLSEAKLCEIHDVSRTPVRLALRVLEREGIIQRGEGRGYSIQAPTITDIRQAVQVRGHLESLAARLMAQADNDPSKLDQMAQAIERIDALTDLSRLDDKIIREMHAANLTFHTSILEGCGNSYVQFTCEQISHLPMLAAGSMVFDRSALSGEKDVEKSILRLKFGNSQHRIIYEAIKQGDAVRAEGMMREHANTMIEYIETFERQNSKLTVSDLVSYSVSGEPTNNISTKKQVTQ